MTGREAADHPALEQPDAAALEMLTARGVLTKINSVLIPGINDEHLYEVNREVQEARRFPAQHHAVDFSEAGAWHRCLA